MSSVYLLIILNNVFFKRAQLYFILYAFKMYNNNIWADKNKKTNY